MDFFPSAKSQKIKLQQKPAVTLLDERENASLMVRLTFLCLLPLPTYATGPIRILLSYLLYNYQTYQNDAVRYYTNTHMHKIESDCQSWLRVCVENF